VRRALSALAAAALLAGCVALADRPEFARNPTRDLREPDRFPAKKGEPCRIFVVPEAPKGAKRIGSIHVPAKVAAEQRIDEESREYGCGLEATHAVREAEVIERGQRVWILGLWRQ
jgi:hypothetical protein